MPMFNRRYIKHKHKWVNLVIKQLSLGCNELLVSPCLSPILPINHDFITYMTTLLIVNPMLLMLVSLVVETRHWSWTMFSTFVPNNGSLRTNSTHKNHHFPIPSPWYSPFHLRDIPILLVSTTMGGYPMINGGEVCRVKTNWAVAQNAQLVDD